MSAADFLREHEPWSLNGSIPLPASDPPLEITMRDSAGNLTGVAMITADTEELTVHRWASEPDSEWPLMDAVVAEASARHCTRVRGEFVATGQNQAMREFLAQFGFTMIGEDQATTLWILPVSAYEPAG